MTDDEFERDGREEKDEGELESVLRLRQFYGECGERQTADEQLAKTNKQKIIQTNSSKKTLNKAAVRGEEGQRWDDDVSVVAAIVLNNLGGRMSDVDFVPSL